MNGQCVVIQDGYYYVSVICIVLGVLACVLYIIPTAKRLEGEPRSPASGFDRSLTRLCSIACDQMAGSLCTVTYVAQQHRSPSYNLSGYLENPNTIIALNLIAFLRRVESRDYFRASPSWGFAGVLEKTWKLCNLLRYYDNDPRELFSCSNTFTDTMATTTMHFGPEWMRKQPTPAPRSSQTDFHPGSTTAIPGLNPTASTPPISSYSASVTFGTVRSEKQDGIRPLRYSKEEMIRIYRERAKTTLGSEVERWDGITREIGADPIGTKEMSDAEKRVSALRCPSS